MCIYKKIKKTEKKVLSGSNTKIKAHVATREKVPKNDQKLRKLFKGGT
jgi:hypothetical protein